MPSLPIPLQALPFIKCPLCEGFYPYYYLTTTTEAVEGKVWEHRPWRQSARVQTFVPLSRNCRILGHLLKHSVPHFPLQENADDNTRVAQRLNEHTHTVSTICVSCYYHSHLKRYRRITKNQWISVTCQHLNTCQ